MTASFAKVVAESIAFNRQTDLFSRCFSNVILPAGDVVLQDGAGTTGAQTFKEFWYLVVGFTGEAQNFDGNGQYTRVQTGGGANVVKSKKLPGTGPPSTPSCSATRSFRRSAPGRRARTRSRPTSRSPPATRTSRPDLNGPAAAAGPPDAMGRADDQGDPETPARLHRDHRAWSCWRCSVGGYILSNQRFYLPGWVPVARHATSSSSRASSQTAQSVMPGQGQTVDIAGVQVGDVKNVELENGRAMITMTVQKKYAADDQEGRVHAAAAEDRASTT